MAHPERKDSGIMVALFLGAGTLSSCQPEPGPLEGAWSMQYGCSVLPVSVSNDGRARIGMTEYRITISSIGSTGTIDLTAEDGHLLLGRFGPDEQEEGCIRLAYRFWKEGRPEDLSEAQFRLFRAESRAVLAAKPTCERNRMASRFRSQ